MRQGPQGIYRDPASFLKYQRSRSMHLTFPESPSASFPHTTKGGNRGSRQWREVWCKESKNLCPSAGFLQYHKSEALLCWLQVISTLGQQQDGLRCCNVNTCEQSPETTACFLHCFMGCFHETKDTWLSWKLAGNSSVLAKDHGTSSSHSGTLPSGLLVSPGWALYTVHSSLYPQG